MKVLKVIVFCFRCERYEYCEEAGPFFFRCTECMALVPKELKATPDGGFR